MKASKTTFGFYIVYITGLDSEVVTLKNFGGLHCLSIKFKSKCKFNSVNGVYLTKL